MFKNLKTKLMFMMFMLIAVGPAFAADEGTSACAAVTTLKGMGSCVEEKISGLETAVIGVAIAGLVLATILGAYGIFRGLAKKS